MLSEGNVKDAATEGRVVGLGEDLHLGGGNVLLVDDDSVLGRGDNGVGAAHVEDHKGEVLVGAPLGAAVKTVLERHGGVLVDQTEHRDTGKARGVHPGENGHC